MLPRLGAPAAASDGITRPGPGTRLPHPDATTRSTRNTQPQVARSGAIRPGCGTRQRYGLADMASKASLWPGPRRALSPSLVTEPDCPDLARPCLPCAAGTPRPCPSRRLAGTDPAGCGAPSNVSE